MTRGTKKIRLFATPVRRGRNPTMNLLASFSGFLSNSAFRSPAAASRVSPRQPQVGARTKQWAVLVTLSVPGACSPIEGETGGPSTAQGGSSFYPEIRRGIDFSEQEKTGDNPWLIGWGGSLTSLDEPPPDGQRIVESPVEVRPSPGSAPVTLPEAEEEGPILPAEEPPWVWRFTDMREGEGSDKLLALRSVLDASFVSKGPCELRQYSNASTSPSRTIPLPAALDSEALSLCTDQSPEHPCDIHLAGVLYNGNDALVIHCGEVAVDRLGRVGEDPGEAWTDPSAQFGTRDTHLVRCEDVIAAEISAVDPAAPYLLSGWVPWQRDEPRSAALARCDSQDTAGAAGASNAP